MTTGRGDPGLQATTETEEGDGGRGGALGFHRLPVTTTARLHRLSRTPSVTIQTKFYNSSKKFWVLVT